ncbi:SigB/SigF/SigG family RNA polymerase sigma factor [Streptomyces sp. NPDC093225]|uniref:SigB/SigF/SigG family RNA polymerase sigma factor n=1 Tax=Streptomyces sp. NPDC093225 TaxID=3366034 RepID=UPI0037FC571D
MTRTATATGTATGSSGAWTQDRPDPPRRPRPPHRSDPPRRTDPLRPTDLPPRTAPARRTGRPLPPAPPGLTGLPELPDPRTVTCAQARAVSTRLFVLLREAEEGGVAYSYLRNALVELNISLVKHAARRFRGVREPMDDIIQVGVIGLIKAINRFDPDREVEFASFAMPTILGEMKRFFRDTGWSVRVPRRLQELRLELARATDDLTQRLDHEPTTADLADALGISETEVAEGRRAANGFTSRSLDVVFDDSETGNRLTRSLGATDPSYERIELLTALRPLVAGLSERDRRILSLRYVDELTQAEIGARIGVSQMQVSRLLTRILGALRAGLDS